LLSFALASFKQTMPPGVRENNPASILGERVAATPCLWHNYCKSTIGSKDDIEKVPVERLATFYKKFYQPDDAVPVITGKLDETKTLQMVAYYAVAAGHPEAAATTKISLRISFNRDFAAAAARQESLIRYVGARAAGNPCLPV
jgi:Zn-dependent M16 (insulinase) family peptidase